VGLALRAIGSALAQVVGHFGVLLITNISAVLLSMPLLVAMALLSAWAQSLPLFPLGVVLIVGVLPNPAAAGLHFSASELARGDPLYQSDQWVGLREHWSFALRMWLISLAVTSVILLNVVFYGRAAVTAGAPLHEVARPAQTIWLLGFFLWLALHLYIFPLVIAQDVRGTLTTYRNAFVILAARPVFSLTAASAWLAILLVAASTGLAVIIGLAAAAAIQHNALARIVPSFRPDPERNAAVRP
jgi:hypothetical protein